MGWREGRGRVQAREGSEGNKGQTGESGGESGRESAQKSGLRAWLHPDADER